MKKLIIILAALAVIGAAVYYLTPSTETIVKNIVHKYGSQVTGTDVNLGGFQLDLMNGKAEIQNLTVANPENYSRPHIMSVGRVAVKVNLKSILSNTIIIENIEIEKPEISYEMLSITQNNISQLLANIKDNTASDKTPKITDKKVNASEQQTVKDSKKVIIEHLTVCGGNIALAASLAGQKSSVEVPLPKIKMQDIGKEKNKNGTDIADTISVVLQKIFDTAYQTVVKSKLVDLKSAAEDSLNNVVDSIKEKSGLKNWFGLGK